jgi:hypothetical protein
MSDEWDPGQPWRSRRKKPAVPKQPRQKAPPFARLLGGLFAVVGAVVCVGFVVALLTGGRVHLNIGHDPTDDRLSALSRQVSKLSRKVDSLQDVTAPDATESFAPAPTTTLLDLPIPNHDAEVLAVNTLMHGLFVDVTSPWQQLVVDPTGLDATMAGLRASPCRPGSVLNIATISFSSDHDARIGYSFAGPNVPTPEFGFVAHAVKVGSTWRMADESVTSLYDTSRPICSPTTTTMAH